MTIIFQTFAGVRVGYPAQEVARWEGAVAVPRPGDVVLTSSDEQRTVQADAVLWYDAVTVRVMVR